MSGLSEHDAEFVRRCEAAAASAQAEVDRLTALINRPVIADFINGVEIEAAHQRERWGAAHDAGKAPWDWYWALAHLASKCVHALVAGDREKALHHTISSAALLANWHADISRSTK